MINSSMQKLNRVATSIVAAATLVLTTFAGALPASATAPTPNANSQMARTTLTSDWNIGSSSTTTLSGVRGVTWYASYLMDPTALRGKTLSFTAAVSGLPSGYTAYGSADIQFYNNSGFISSGYVSSSSGGGTPVVVPQAATSMNVSPRISVMNSSYMGYGLNTAPTGTFTPSFDIKADGTSITRNDTYSSNYSGSMTVLHLSSQPEFNQEIATASWTGSAGYTDLDQEVVTCVDISGMTAGTTLTVSTLVDGVANTSASAPSSQTLETRVGTSGSRSIVLSQNQISTGEMLELDWSYFSQAGLTSGSHSAAISVTANGTEVTTACQLKSASSVTPSLAYSAIPSAGLYITVTDSAFQNQWTYTVYKTSDNSVVATGNGWGNSNPTRIYSCGMNGCSSPVAPGVSVYVKVKRSQSLLSGNSGMQMVYSTESQPSGSAQLPDPWISVTAPSAGSAPGDAKLVGQNIDYAIADTNTSMLSPSASMRVASDGKNGVLRGGVVFNGCTGPNEPCTLTAKLYRISSAGIDTAFGTNGVTLATYDGSGPGANPDSIYPAWYGQRNKWTAVIKEADYSSMNPVITYGIVSGNFTGGAASSKVTLTEPQLLTYCGAGFTRVGFSAISAPTAAQLFAVTCMKSSTINSNVYYSSKVNYVNVAANGTITTVFAANAGDWVTDSSFSALVFSSNVSASASSDVALTIVGYTYTITGSGPSGYTGNIVSRVGAQIKVDGTAVTVSTPYTSSATVNTDEKSFIFSRTTTGVATTGFVRTVSNSVASYSYATLNADGTITEGDPVTWDTVTGFDAALPSFVDGQDVGTTGKVQLLRKVGVTKVAAATLDLDTKQIDTGEVVTYANSTDSRVINFTFLDPQGRVNWMFTSAASKLSLVRWNGVSGGGALPDGVTVTSVSTKYITNAAAVVTITGTGLGAWASGATKLTVGGTLVSPSTKSATKIVVTVPAGTVAGDIQINAPLAGGDATLATVTRVGATKQEQTITDTQDAQATWSGVGSKTTATFPATTDKGLATTIKVDKAAICSVSGQTVTMNAAGTCVVTVASAGDLGTNAASQTTTIVVAKRDKGNVNAIVSAVTAAAGAWTGTNITATIPALLTSIGLNATVTVAPAAVCTLSGAVLTIKAAGTCAVSVTGAADPGTDAIAKQVANVVVTKGNLNLEVDATVTVTNNPADSNNTVQLDTGIANGAVGIVDFTFASSNEDICTVDENGVVTGVAVGTCTITTDAEADNNWLADEATTTVTVEDSNTTVDVLPEVGDGLVAPKPVSNNKSAFVSTNDASLLVKWDKAAGLLTLQSKGVYIGFIKAEITFTKDGTQYTCTNVFGTTAKLASKTAAQKKASLKTKVYTATAAACKDTSKLSVPGSISAPADFAKIAKAAKTAPEKAAETVAFGKLKNFVGNMSIKVTRYRAWPTTMQNKAGHTSTGKGIPATVRTTVIGLQ